jgi:hypothetical protein
LKQTKQEKVESMNKVKVLIAIAVIALVGTMAVRAGGVEDVPAVISSNLYINASSGITKADDKNEALNASVGIQDGFAVYKFDNNAILGGQLGGSAGMSETDSGANKGVYNGNAGLFLRGLPCKNNQTAAVAALFTYDRNTRGSDLWAFRPIAGLSINDKNSFGGKGVLHLNTNSNGDEATDSGAGFWVHKWNDRFSTETTVGYKGGDVKGVYAGPALAYSIDKNWDLAVKAERDSHGDYLAVFQVVYGFGGKGIHSTLDNVSGNEATPFPVGR